MRPLPLRGIISKAGRVGKGEQLRRAQGNECFRGSISCPSTGTCFPGGHVRNCSHTGSLWERELFLTVNSALSEVGARDSEVHNFIEKAIMSWWPWRSHPGAKGHFFLKPTALPDDQVSFCF